MSPKVQKSPKMKKATKLKMGLSNKMMIMIKIPSSRRKKKFSKANPKKRANQKK